jgi:hypothetical protein
MGTVSDDTPTQRFDPPAIPPARTAASDDDRKSRLPLILGIVGGVLLLAVIVLLVLLLGRSPGSTNAGSTNSPSATASPSSTPTPVPTPTVTVTVTPAPSGGGGTPPKPNGNNVLITNYAISPTLVDCSASAPAGAANLTIAWKSVNGNTAFFGVNTTDAQAAGMGWNLPASGSNLDFPSGAGNPYTYQCGDAQESFTITVVGNGSKQSLTITVRKK